MAVSRSPRRVARRSGRRPARPVTGALALAVVTVSLAACVGGRQERTSSTTTGPPSTQWPARRIAGVGTVQDLAPTAGALYWLVVTSPASAAPVTITPTRYDLASHQVTSGPSATGVVGGQALTVTGGWAWLVIGEGGGALVEQLDPTTLAVHAERSLPVTDTIYPSPLGPVLTATVGGPLWVAAGEDLWALNPSTGVIETELDAGNQISSMSTAPDGTVLYTSGVVSDGGGSLVTEYDARTGGQRDRSDQPDTVGAGTVAATASGAWVSYRTGMAGAALELSSDGLNKIAPPTDARHPFGTFDQIMGVGSGVSEGVLWLTSATDLTCADPETSVVRAREATTVSDPVASGGRLYALAPSGGVVVITPPTVCFGPGDRVRAVPWRGVS